MRADRLISILMLLQTRGQMTAQALAGKLEVSERTIYRDLDALSASGVPIYAERGPGGGCTLLESYRSNLTGLNEEELRALFMVSVPGPLDDLGMKKALEAAQLKLSATLSAGRREAVDRVRQRIFLDASGWFYPPEPVPYLEIIQEAVWDNRRLRTVYRRSDGQWSTYLLEPYGLVAKAGIWYMVAGMGHARGPLTYRISRIQEASLTESTFERPANFDLASYWPTHVKRFETSQTQYSATLRVSGAFIPRLAHFLGEGVQQVIEQAGLADESGCVTLTLSFKSLEEARMYVLGFGTAVEVIAPQELKAHAIQFAQEILTFYQS
jgi:predicted DNA-binding transcriptional regulator YafY